MPEISDIERITRRLAGGAGLKAGETGAKAGGILGKGKSLFGKGKLLGAGMKGLGALGTLWLLLEALGAAGGDRNELDPSVLFGMDVTKAEKKKLSKQLEALEKDSQKKELVRSIVKERYGEAGMPTATESLRSDPRAMTDMRAAMRAIPLMAETGKSAEDILGPEIVGSSRILQSLTTKERDDLRKIVSRETRDLDKGVQDFLSGR